MANGHGGYRKPEHPAPVSGPGKYSKRTDGGPAQVLSAAPDQGYGEAGQQLDAQRIAPMAGTAPMPPAAPLPNADSGGAGPTGPTAGFGDPTSRPDEPITAGVNIGPGPGSMFLPSPAQGTGFITSLLQRLSATDTTGLLAQLAERAGAVGA